MSRQSKRALEEGLRAGGHAVALQESGRYDEALHHYGIAIDALRRAEDAVGVGRVLYNRGVTLVLAGRRDEAATAFECAVQTLRRAGDREGLAEALGSLATEQMRRGEPAAAVATWKELLPLRRQVGPAENVPRILTLLVEQQRLAGDLEGATASCKELLLERGDSERGDSAASVAEPERALPRVPEPGDVEAIRVCMTLVSAYGEREEFRRGAELAHEAGELLGSLGDAKVVTAMQALETRLLASHAAVAQRSYRLGDAVSRYAEALEPARRSGNLELLAETLLQAGVAHSQLRDERSAQPLFAEALAAARELGDPRLEGAALMNLARLETTGASAPERLAQLALARKRCRAAGYEAGVAASLLHTAVIHREVGEYPLALSTLEEALGGARQAGERELEGQVFDAMGTIHRRLGDFGMALTLHLQALAVQRELGDEPGIQGTLANLGTIDLMTGDYAEALGYFYEAMQIGDRLGTLDRNAEILNKTGLALDRMGNRQDAVALLERALEIARSHGDRSEEANILGNLAMIYGFVDEDGLGGLDRTLEALRTALAVAVAEGNRSLEGTLRSSLGTVLQTGGRLAEALPELTSGLEIARAIGDRDAELVALSNIGFYHEQAGDASAAEASYREAVEVLERMRLGPGDGELREGVLSSKIHAYESLVLTLLKAGKKGEAFEYAERSRARGALDMLAEAVAGVRRGVDPELLEAERRLHGEVFELSRRLREERSEAERMALANRRREAEEDLARLARRVRERTPAYADLRYADPVQLKEVQERVLDEGEVLVEFFWHLDELVVFVVGGARISTERIDGADELVEKVRELVQSVRRGPGGYDAGLAAEIYERILAPVADGIAEVAGGRPSGLVVVPDGILSYLPLECLVVGTSDSGRPRYLLEEHEISYAPSASVLGAARSRPRPASWARQALALAPFAKPGGCMPAAAPAADARRSAPLRDLIDAPEPLPSSSLELDAIAALFDDTLCLRDSEATQAALEANGPGSRYLHLATHGYLDSERPAYSGVLLAGDVLQTYEIFDLKLDAELTVLSACETGLGRLRRGEGIVGLTRAFLYAGSPSLVVSLWRVADTSTAALVARMYGNLRAGGSQRTALTEAKRWMLDAPPGVDELGYELRYDDPFYWAPFILVGAAR
jgi:CHAT domain-containing protein